MYAISNVKVQVKIQNLYEIYATKIAFLTTATRADLELDIIDFTSKKHVCKRKFLLRVSDLTLISSHLIVSINTIVRHRKGNKEEKTLAFQ